MKKQIKLLIVGAVVIVLLIAALIFTMKWIGPTDDSSTSSSSADVSALMGESVYLNEGKTSADLSKITFKNTLGTYQVDKVDDTNFIIEEIKDTPYDSSKVNGMGSFAATFYASDTVSKEGEGADLTMYGLNEPRCEITATYSDGSEFTILLGNDAPSNRGVYGKTPDSDAVYVFSHANADPFLNDFTYLMQTELAPDYEGYAYGYFESMTVSGSDIGTDKPIVIGLNEDIEDSDDVTATIGAFSMSSHENTIVNFEYVADMLNTVFPTTAEEVIAVNPSQDQLAEYGLDNPRVKMTINYTDDDDVSYSLTLAAGNSVGGYVYVTNEKSNIIYKIAEPESTDMSWTTMTYLKLQNKLFLFPMLKKLDYIEVVENGTNYTFDITATDSTNDAGETTTTISTTYDGKTLDSDNFSKFYQVLIGMRKDRLTTAESTPEGTPEVKITYHYVDESTPDDVIEFYPASDSERHYHVAVNGKVEFDTLTYYMDKLKEDIQNLLNGKEINTDF